MGTPIKPYQQYVKLAYFCHLSTLVGPDKDKKMLTLYYDTKQDYFVLCKGKNANPDAHNITWVETSFSFMAVHVAKHHYIEVDVYGNLIKSSDEN